MRKIPFSMSISNPFSKAFSHARWRASSKPSAPSLLEPAVQLFYKENVYLWLTPVLFMIVVGLYFPMRYAGHWAESDSASFTFYIRSFIAQQRLVPLTGQVYPNGYAYQAISAFLISLTGLDVTTLQQWVYPLLSAMVVFPAWIVYRELTGSHRGAAFATILLFTQPEFLFVVLRSSHEKFTRALMLLCLFWLVRSFSYRDQPRKLAVYLVLIYLTAFSLIASNNLLANSFFFSIGTALLLGALFMKLNPRLRENDYIIKRFPYTVLISLGLVFIFTSYIYPPAQHDLEIFKNVWERVQALFMDVQAQTTNAYTTVVLSWVNLPVYFMLSINNWIVLIASFAIWLRQGWRWFFRADKPKNEIAWLIWLLYLAFAIQGVLSAITDASGSLTSNLQHRIFSSFTMIAVVVVSTELAKWQPQKFRKLFAIGFSAAIFLISVLSVMKATNEPIFSNKWTFYQPEELSALDWANLHMNNAEIWTEYDERLIVAYLTTRGSSANDLTIQSGERTHDFLVTDVSRLRGLRIRQPLPVLPDAYRVYDNGLAQLYHLKPLSIYQP